MEDLPQVRSDDIRIGSGFVSGAGTESGGDWTPVVIMSAPHGQPVCLPLHEAQQVAERISRGVAEARRRMQLHKLGQTHSN